MSRYEEQKKEYEQNHPILDDAAKIKHFQKLDTFNELIKQLVDWKKETNGQSEQDILKDLSFVPLMKCLYFVCLLSVHKNSNKNNTLFDLFEFTAYPQGPVEEECYYHINDLANYKIKLDDGKEFIAKREGNNVSNLCGSNPYLNNLNNAVQELKNALYFPGFREREELVDLSHDKLWKEAFEKANRTMNIESERNWKEVFEEAKRFRLSIAA